MPQDLQTPGVTLSGEEEPFWTPAVRRRTLLTLIALLCVLLLVVVPPYFSVSRYQRRVAAAISGALGRPVHFDRISLHVLPIPGLTIDNFVVNEIPEFGGEPVMRANTVEARLRVSSLWRRRIEVSRISLQSPSINLVRRPSDTRWNLQGILMQASQMNSAPTAQQKAGDAPRFPYIEATDARINIKNGDSKLPFSVKEAEFALWLPEPDEWRVRMVGKPVRTDTDVNDVGLLRVEATLGRAVELEKAPIDLSASWKPTPLGEAGKLTVGYDTGWRGEASASATLHGTLGAAQFVTDLHLRSLHRADFLPEQSINWNAHCEAHAAGLLRSLRDVRCAAPIDNSLSFAGVMEALGKAPPAQDVAAGNINAARPGVMLLQGEVPNVLDWQTARGSLLLNDAPAAYGLNWARLFTRSLPADLDIGGSFDLSSALEPAGGTTERVSADLVCTCILPQPQNSAVEVQAPGKQQKANTWIIHVTRLLAYDAHPPLAFGFLAHPAPADRANDPVPTNMAPGPGPFHAHDPVEGTLERDGYAIRYAGAEDVKQAGRIVPRLLEGLPVNRAGTLEVRAGWYTPPVWSSAKAVPARKHRR